MVPIPKGAPLASVLAVSVCRDHESERVAVDPVLERRVHLDDLSVDGHAASATGKLDPAFVNDERIHQLPTIDRVFPSECRCHSGRNESGERTSPDDDHVEAAAATLRTTPH
jgi:hypothetical protein